MVGLGLAAGDQPAAPIKQAFLKLAEGDSSDVVRVAAAHRLCRWGESAKGIPILSAALDSPQRSLQLHAAHALEDVGEQARPLLPKLKRLAIHSSEYVERVVSNTVSQLELADAP